MLAKRGMSDRVKFFAGNFFTDPLPAADVLIMGRILHDWDLAQKRMLLEKANAALPTGGALIVYEAIIDDERRENAFGLLGSLNMLLATLGGFDLLGPIARLGCAKPGSRRPASSRSRIRFPWSSR
jgi:hypothetical protein